MPLDIMIMAHLFIVHLFREYTAPEWKKFITWLTTEKNDICKNLVRHRVANLCDCTFKNVHLHCVLSDFAQTFSDLFLSLSGSIEGDLPFYDPSSNLTEEYRPRGILDCHYCFEN